MQVTLKKPHTHAGKELPPGATLDVDAGTAQWLASLDIIEPLDPPPAESGAGKPTKKGS